MAREHPRGAVLHAGCQLRYLVGSAHGWLGGAGFAAPALRLKARDDWIGWDEACRARNLHLAVGLSRFLIRPSVRCRNLASRVLALCLGRLEPGRADRRAGAFFRAGDGWRAEGGLAASAGAGVSVRPSPGVRSRWLAATGWTGHAGPATSSAMRL